MTDTSVRQGRFLSAIVIKPLKNSVLLLMRVIPEADIIEVLSTIDKNFPVLHGSFDQQKRVPVDVLSIISVRGEASPLALLNGAGDFIQLGWRIAPDGKFEEAENSDGLITAIEDGFALSALVDMVDPAHVPYWGDGEDTAHTPLNNYEQ